MKDKKSLKEDHKKCALMSEVGAIICKWSYEYDVKHSGIALICLMQRLVDWHEDSETRKEF